MATRRMFSKTITNSSKFLMMPPTSQLLYIHLGMNADDDGFCEHFSIMRMTESKPDDLRILQAKGFVKVFDDKVLVIMDWKENNYLRNDRYTPSKYLQTYKRELENLDDKALDTNGIPTVYQRYPQDRLGKVSIGKVINKNLSKDKLAKAYIDLLGESFFKTYGLRPIDTKWRFEAWNLLRRIKKMFQEKAVEATEEKIRKTILIYFEWLSKQNWRLSKMRGAREHFEEFYSETVTGTRKEVEPYAN